MVTLVNADPSLAEAIEQARKAVKNSPGSAKAWGHLGAVYQAHAFMTEAQVCLAQAMRLDPEDGRWAYLHALYVCQTDPEQGIPALAHAAELCEGIAAPRLKLGEVLLETGRVDEAETTFRAVLAYDLDNPRAELGLGRAAYARGNWQESVAHLKRSVARAPGVRATHAVLAEVYQRLGDARGAQEELERVAETSDNALWPDPYQEAVGRLKTGIEARLEHAQMLLQQGRAAQAIPLVEELLRSRPDADAVHLAYGRLLKNAPARAEAEFRQALALRPTSLSAQTELAQALEMQGKYREAADYYRKAVDLKPQDGPVHHRLGLCLQRLGDKEGAMRELRIAVKCKPNLTVAYRDLAELLVENGGFDEAALHLQDALRLAPADDAMRRLLTQVREQAARAPKR
jgi:tetratricopeptide (TPR) repeat protein